MTPRPLPRSLDPLPEESLTGYLLRLSHRLEITPARLEVLTGLASLPGSAGVVWQWRIPEPRAAVFARTTRLSRAEADQLCLDGLRDRYPPLLLNYALDGHWVRRGKDLPGMRGWISTTSTRYCPQCLAGDGSPVQQAHGGAWRRQWRLKAIFACDRHQRLLRYRCPACDTPALGRTTHANRLIPAPSLLQHPTRCRNLPACNHPLDKDTNTKISTAAAPRHQTRLRYLLDFHARLTQQLELDHSGAAHQPQRASQYFFDLQLLTRLIRHCWPLAAPLASPLLDIDALSAHVNDLHRTMATLRAENKPVWNMPLRAGPPEDPYSTAQLLTLAGQLREHPDHIDEHLAVLLRTVTPPSRIEPMLQPCSPALRVIAQPYLDRLTQARRQTRPATTPPRRITARRPPQPVRPLPAATFDHRHIPHQFDHDHIQPLTDLIPHSDVEHQLLHRYAALHTFTAATGRAMAAAARTLEIPEHKAQHAHSRVTIWAREHNATSDLDTAMRTVFDNIDNSDTRIDYQRRRHALRGWTIPEHDWNLITSPLVQAQRATKVPSTTDWGPRKRLIASLLLWTVITRGDYTTAPLYLQRSHVHPHDRRFVVLAQRLMHEYRKPPMVTGRGSHVTVLLNALAAYRASLEQLIDDGALISSTP